MREPFSRKAGRIRYIELIWTDHAWTHSRGSHPLLLLSIPPTVSLSTFGFLNVGWGEGWNIWHIISGKYLKLEPLFTLRRVEHSPLWCKCLKTFLVKRVAEATSIAQQFTWYGMIYQFHCRLLQLIQCISMLHLRYFISGSFSVIRDPKWEESQANVKMWVRALDDFFI